MFGVVIDVPLFTRGIDNIKMYLVFPDFTFGRVRQEMKSLGWCEKVKNTSVVW